MKVENVEMAELPIPKRPESNVAPSANPTRGADSSAPIQSAAELKSPKAEEATAQSLPALDDSETVTSSTEAANDEKFYSSQLSEPIQQSLPVQSPQPEEPAEEAHLDSPRQAAAGAVQRKRRPAGDLDSIAPSWISRDLFRIRKRKLYKPGAFRYRVNCLVCGLRLIATKQSIQTHLQSKYHCSANSAPIAKTKPNRRIGSKKGKKSKTEAIPSSRAASGPGKAKRKQKATKKYNPKLAGRRKSDAIPKHFEWLPPGEFQILRRRCKGFTSVRQVECNRCGCKMLAQRPCVEEHRLLHQPVSEVPEWVPAEIFRVFEVEEERNGRQVPIRRLECRVCGQIFGCNSSGIRSHLGSRIHSRALESGVEADERSSPKRLPFEPEHPVICSPIRESGDLSAESEALSAEESPADESSDAPEVESPQPADSKRFEKFGYPTANPSTPKSSRHHRLQSERQNHEICTPIRRIPMQRNRISMDSVSEKSETLSAEEFSADERSDTPAMETPEPTEDSKPATEPAFIRIYFTSAPRNQLQCLLCKLTIPHQSTDAKAHLQHQHAAQYEAIRCVFEDQSEKQPDDDDIEILSVSLGTDSPKSVTRIPPVNDSALRRESRKRKTSDQMHDSVPESTKRRSLKRNSSFALNSPNPLNSFLHQTSMYSQSPNSSTIEFIDWTKTKNPPKAFHQRHL